MEDSLSSNNTVHESAPPLMPNEIQLCIHNFKDRFMGQHSEPMEAIYSDWKHLDNFTFRLMVFPTSPDPHKGPNVNSIGTFIEVQPRPDWPDNWAFYGVQYNIIVINQVNSRKSIYKQDMFTFTKHEIDRGWHGIASHQQLKDGFLTSQGDLHIRAGVYIQGTELDMDARDHDCDSRTLTGYVGLLNHGATCYMNALIQGLYHIGKFRSWVFSLNFDNKELSNPHSRRIISKLINPTDGEMCIDIGADSLDDQDARKLLLEEEVERSKVPPASLALQNLFYKLYFSREAPGCRELIKSFGWDAIDAFTQHDSHELLKLLLSKVEEQMKGTPAEGSVNELFGGEMETYIECIDIDYKSARKESFEDIQLDVQGCKDIYESLRMAIEPEILDGDNMYEAEGHGKQRARKGMRFLKFPNVCIFLLKRFTFNLQCMDTVKLNTRFEFYREIDLTPFRLNSSNNEREEYVLQAVSVHQGGMNSGHYYAFCRTGPNGKGGWLKFDDDKVYRVSEYSAIGDNFGGPIPECRNYLSELYHNSYSSTRLKQYSAYILVYVKKSRADEILCESDPRVVNPEVVTRCQLQERISSIRQQVRQRLSKFVKVRLFFRSDFINYSFLDQPFNDWREPGTMIKFERNEVLGIVLLKLSKVIAGYEVDSKIDLSKLNYDVSNFHILGLSADINRFEHLAQFDPDNSVKKDDLTKFSGVIAEPIQELIRRVNPNILDPYNPTLYLLYFPFHEDSFKLFSGESEKTASNVAMLMIKYFDIFTKTPSKDNLICVDLVYVNADNRLLQLELPLIESLIQLMNVNAITPHRKDELAALAKNYRNSINTSPKSARDGLYLELHDTLENSGLSLICYVETNGKCEFVSLKKTLLQHKIFTGDILVFNFLPNEEMILDRGTTFNSKEDFEITGEEIASTSDVFISEFDPALFSGPISELFAGRGGGIPETPPPLPKFPVYDFPSLLDLLENRATILFKLYDPLQTLALPVDCSGKLLAETPGINLDDFHPAPGISSFSSLESDISDEDPTGSCAGAIKSLPIITRTFVLDLRSPVKKMLKYVCWNLKVDPSRILLYPGPPLLCSSTCEPFSIDHFFHRDSSLGYEQVTLRELIKIFRACNSSKSVHATLHLCLLPWHYSKVLRVLPFDKFPKEDCADRAIVAQVLNHKVQVTRSIIVIINLNDCKTVGDLLEKIGYGTNNNSNMVIVREEGCTIEYYDNKTPILSLPQLSHSVRNVFARLLRIEPGYTNVELEHINLGKLKPLVVTHQTPERDPFGFGFIILVQPGENIGSIKAKIKEKVGIPQNEWLRWSFMQFDGTNRTWKSNDDSLDMDNPKISFLAEHQMPYRRAWGQAIMKLV